jgi:hypothetical protein
VEIAVVEGADLGDLLDLLDEVNVGDPKVGVHPRRGVYKVTFWVDGGIKIKVNEDTWSRPHGRTETIKEW